MISGDGKADVKQQETKELLVLSLTFHKKYLRTLKYNVKGHEFFI